MKLKKAAFRLTKGRIVVLSITILLILVGAYVYSSFRVWENYENSYTTLRQDIGQDIDAALQLSAVSSDDRLKKIVALEEVTTTISDKQSICDMPGVFSWQRSIGGLGSRTDTCNETIDAMTEYGGSLNRAVVYLKAEREIASIIGAAATNSKQTEKTLDTQLTAWTKAVSDIGVVQAPEEFISTKEYALKYASKMESAWKDVIAAHKAQNKSKYLKAYADLVGAHEMLATLASKSQDGFTIITKELQTRYDALQ